MAWSSLTWFDAAAAIVIFLSAFLAYRTGFLAELIPTLALLAAVALALVVASDLKIFVVRFVTDRGPLTTFAIGLIVFFVSFVFFYFASFYRYTSE